MSSARPSSSFAKYLVLFFATIGVLFLLQQVLRKRDFAYRFAEEAVTTTPVPLDAELMEVSLTKPAKFGKTVTLKSVLEKSKTGVLINFWATWCPPCIEELPSLEMYSRQARSNGQLPKLILISVDDGLQPLQQLFDSLDFKASFELYLDRSGRLASQMGSSKFPETYLISSLNDVLLKWIGPQDWLSVEVLEKLRLAASGHPKAQNQLE